jgi:hypothetical protein
MRTTKTVPVIVCDDCENEIREDEPFITLMVRAIRSDVEKPPGIEGWTAMKEAGLIENLELHNGCIISQRVIDKISGVVVTAGDTTELPA